MKISANTSEIQTSNIGEQQNFTIESSGFAFKILSDGLYSDRITAIIRELSCNAIDSHKAINSSEPFIIKLPDYNDSNFYVQDFGLGLSHNDVLHLFSTYFGSNKTNDNSSIGGFGLGSKSPFSYSDSFLVTSVYNNEKRMYTAYISENGIPKISSMGMEKTDEHNGVKIEFQVNSKDFYDFTTKCEETIRYFDIKPKILGGMGIKYKKIEYIQKHEHWGERTNLSSKDSGVNLIIGGVAYPLNVLKLPSIYSSIGYINLDIFFDIGQISINPSREAINYRDSDVETIKKAIHSICKDVMLEQQAKIQNAPTQWEAACIYNDAHDSLQIFARKISTELNIDCDFSYNGDQKFNEIELDSESSTGVHIKEPQSKRSYKTWYGTHAIKPYSHTVVFYNDLPKGGMGRIRHEIAIKDIRTSCIYILEPTTSKSCTYDDAVTLLKGCKLIKASSLEKPVKSHSTIASGYEIYFQSLDTYRGDNRDLELFESGSHRFSLQELEELLQECADNDTVVLYKDTNTSSSHNIFNDFQEFQDKTILRFLNRTHLFTKNVKLITFSKRYYKLIDYLEKAEQSDQYCDCVFSPDRFKNYLIETVKENYQHIGKIGIHILHAIKKYITMKETSSFAENLCVRSWVLKSYVDTYSQLKVENPSFCIQMFDDYLETHSEKMSAKLYAWKQTFENPSFYYQIFDIFGIKELKISSLRDELKKTFIAKYPLAYSALSDYDSDVDNKQLLIEIADYMKFKDANHESKSD